MSDSGASDTIATGEAGSRCFRTRARAGARPADLGSDFRDRNYTKLISYYLPANLFQAGKDFFTAEALRLRSRSEEDHGDW